MGAPATDAFTVEDRDEDFFYRWVNDDERTVRPAIYAGWEPVEGKPNERLSKVAQQLLGQTTDTPGGGSLIKRGDVILMRMPRALHEEKIAGPRREARERQAASVDTMVAAANERAQLAMRKAGLKQQRSDMAFSTSADGGFSQLQEKKG